MPPTLMIAVPCRAAVRPAAFAAQSWCMVESTLWWRKTFGEDAHVLLNIVYGPGVAKARCMIGDEAVRRGFDWILWMDDDCVPTPGLLERLMRHGKRWIAPVYFGREAPYFPHCYEYREPKFVAINPWPPRLFQAHGIGFHCNLMHTDVIRRTRALVGEGPDLFRDSTQFTEDLYFCVLAHRAGCDLWVDSSVEVGHRAEFTVTGAHWEASGRMVAREQTGLPGVG